MKLMNTSKMEEELKKGENAIHVLFSRHFSKQTVKVSTYFSVSIPKADMSSGYKCQLNHD